MLKTRNPLYRVLLILNLVFVIPCIVGNVINIFNESVGTYLHIGAAFAIWGLISAFYYVVMGYSKNLAVDYKGFIICFVVAYLFEIVDIAVNHPDQILLLVLSSVAFALVLVIAITKDLGQRNSLLICALVILLSAARLVLGVILLPGVFAGDTYAVVLVVVQYTSELIMAMLLGLVTVAKYVDKEARNTK